jgi:hypothetical protein
VPGKVKYAGRAARRPIARDLAGVVELNDVEILPALNTATVELLAYFTALAAKNAWMPDPVTASCRRAGGHRVDQVPQLTPQPDQAGPVPQQRPEPTHRRRHDPCLDRHRVDVRLR